MPDQFDKKTIFNKMRAKAQAKGFNMNPDRSNLPAEALTVPDMLEVMADAIAEVITKDQTKKGTITARELKIGPTGLQQPFAYKNATVKFDITTDPKFFTWIETFHAFLQAVFPEPGNGAPDVFETASKALLAQKPTSLTGKITQGSSSAKVTT